MHKCACVRASAPSLPCLVQTGRGYCRVLRLACDVAAHLLVPVNPRASVCFFNPGDWHTSQQWEQGNSESPRHIHQCKEETEQTRAAVCSILLRGEKREGDWRGKKKSFLSAHRECAAFRWMRICRGEDSKGQFYTSLRGGEWIGRMRWRETTRCCTRGSIYGAADQGWNESKLALEGKKKWSRRTNRWNEHSGNRVLYDN